jgi:hypothetical protein
MIGFGVARLARFLRDQRLPVGDRDLVIVGMDFAESEKAMPVAAVIDEAGLQRRFYARDLGEIDIAAQWSAVCGFKVEFFDPASRKPTSTLPLRGTSLIPSRARRR